MNQDYELNNRSIRGEFVRNMPNMENGERKDELIARLITWYKTEISRYPKGTPQYTHMAEEALRFIEATENYRNSCEATKVDTCARLEELRTLVSGQSDIQAQTREALGMTPRIALTDLKSPYIIGGVNKTIGEWIQRDNEFSPELRSSIIRLVNSPDLSNIHNQIASLLTKTRSGEIVVKKGQHSTVLGILRRAGIAIPTEGGLGGNRYANIISGAISDAVHKRALTVQREKIPVHTIPSEDPVTPVIVPAQVQTPQQPATACSGVEVEDKGSQLFPNGISLQLLRDRRAEVLLALGITEAEIKGVNLASFIEVFHKYETALQGMQQLKSIYGNQISDTFAWRRAGYDAVRIFDNEELQKINALYARTQADGTLRQKLMNILPERYRQENLDTSRISLLPNMTTGKYKHHERVGYTFDELNHILGSMTVFNKQKFIALTENQGNMQQAFEKIKNDIRTYYNSPHRNNHQRLSFHWTLQEYGFSQLSFSQSNALATYILEKGSGGNRVNDVVFRSTEETNTSFNTTGFLFWGNNPISRVDAFEDIFNPQERVNMQNMLSKDVNTLRGYIQNIEQFTDAFYIHPKTGKRQLQNVPSAMATQLRSMGWQGSMSPNTINTVFFFLSDYINDQERFPGLSIYKKMEFLFDADRNGIIEGWNMEGGNMAAIFESVIHNSSPTNIRNLFINLDLGDPETVFREMGTNLFTQRKFFIEQFKRFANGYTPSTIVTLMQSNPQMARIAEAQGNSEASRVRSIVQSHIFKGEGVMALGEPTVNRWVDKIEENIMASYINDIAAVTFGISIDEYTAGWLSKLDFSVGNGGLVVGVSRNLQLGDNTAVTVGAGSGGIFGGLQQHIAEGTYTPDEFFELQRRLTLSVSAGGNISQYGSFLGISISRQNNNTIDGIRQTMDATYKIFQAFKRDVLEGKTAEQVTFLGDTLSPENQAHYTRFFNNFNRFSQGRTPEQREKDYDRYLAAHMRQFCDTLYQNARGFNFSRLDIGLLNKVLPIISFGFDQTKTTTRVTNTVLDVQRDITRIEHPLSHYGAGITTVDGQQVVYVPMNIRKSIFGFDGNEKDIEVGLSVASNTTAQIKRGIHDGKEVYFIGGIAPGQLSFQEHFGTRSRNEMLLCIGGGVQEGERYVSTGETAIVSTITQPIQGVEIGQAGINKFLEGIERIDNPAVQGIIASLSSRVHHDAITTSQTIGMMDLQRDIYRMKRGEGGQTLAKVWNDYLHVINIQKNKDYLSDGEGAIPNYADFLTKHSQITSDAEKLYILQGIALAFTSRGWLQRNPTDSKYTIRGGKTLNDYNTGNGYNHGNRNEYFQRIMQTELGHLSGNIARAREAWNTRFGHLSEYPTFVMTQGEALSANEVRDTSTTGRSHYDRMKGLAAVSGAFDLIGQDETDALFSLGTLDNTQKRALLERQPNYILDAYRTQINTAGANITDRAGLINAIVAGEVQGITIQMDAFFGRNAQCVNDAVVMKIQISRPGIDATPIMISGSSSASLAVQENSVRQWGITMGLKNTRRNDGEGDNPPGKEGGENATDPYDGINTPIDTPTPIPPVHGSNPSVQISNVRIGHRG